MLNKPSVASYMPHLDIEMRAFVGEGLVEGQVGRVPVDPLPMIQRLNLGLVLMLNWGTRLASRDDALFRKITEMEEENSSRVLKVRALKVRALTPLNWT